MTAENRGPLWTQDQAIAYGAALDAINDLIAGYSEQIGAEERKPQPDASRIAWLDMRVSQARDVMYSLSVTDGAAPSPTFEVTTSGKPAVRAGSECSAE